MEILLMKELFKVFTDYSLMISKICDVNDSNKLKSKNELNN